MRHKKLLVGAGLSLLVLLVADQVVQHVALSDGVFMGRPVAPFDPPIFCEPQAKRLALIERSLAIGTPKPESLRFDAELGWCNPKDGGGEMFRYDWAGARVGEKPLSRQKPEGGRTLALYGCSMTHGDEVGALETWAAQLDGLLPGVEVANMGVSAFGIDQALMRQKRDGLALEADEVWMVWMPQATLRITTLYRPLLRHWSSDVAFKPRFKLGSEGKLVVVPNPAQSLADIPLLLGDQELLQERLAGDDYWAKRGGSAYSERGSCPLHYSGFARVLLTAYEATGRELDPHLEAGHSTRVLLEAIVMGSAQEAEAGGATFRLVIIPGPDDLAAAAAGEAPWAGTTRSLREEGVEVVDLTEMLLAADSPYAEHGHLNAGGSRLAAEFLSTIGG
ncbi:MAG: hypothetical protein ACI8QS_001646 [Planctomycetota bacterium]|jgi:hypothetical protein